MEFGEQGVRLSLHHHTKQPVMHRRDFDVFFGAVRPGTVSLTVDTGHLVRSGITEIGSVITDFAPFIDNIHLKDIRDGEFRLLGDGVADLDDALTAIARLGDEVTLCVDEESRADLDTALRASRDYLQSHGLPPSTG